MTEFDSQAKERLSSQEKDFGGRCAASKPFAQQVAALLSLSATMAADGAFARQLRRKFM